MSKEVPRPLHSHASLTRLFAPRSVAMVGISNRPGSFAGRTWANMSQYQGRLYAVNPKYDSYLDQPCYPSLTTLPEVPDCVIVATSRELVEDVVRQCADAGVGGAVVFASGYAETGKPEFIELQQRLGQLAADTGVRVLGPNCMGFVNNGLRAGLTFVTDIPFTSHSGHAIGIVSQSGAIGTALLQASPSGTAFSHMLTAGNSADVDVADQIAYLAQEDDCKAIACVFEGIADPQRLIEAGQMARRANKPVVVFKIARSEQGAQAAASHTGSLAGSDAAWQAALRRGSMVLVDQFEHLLETTTFMAKTAALQPAARGVAVLSVSGGMAIMAADKAEIHGIPLPQPAPDVEQVLTSHIPDFGSARNPFDVTAQVVALPDALGACAGAILGSPEYGAIVFPHPLAQEASLARLKSIDALGREAGKITCTPWITQWHDGPGSSEIEAMPNTALFRSLDACFHALKARDWWQSLPAAAESAASSARARDAAAAQLRAIRGASLTEGEAMRLLTAYDVPTVADRLTASAQEAAEAASQMGFPVAMKVVSRDVPHKTEAGGVELNVADAAGAHAAYERIIGRVTAAVPGAKIEGIVVQPMVPQGVELIVGTKQDPVFGPLIVVGLGGVFVELLRDACVRLAPVDEDEALGMLRSLRGAGLFEGFRGAAAVDLPAVAAIVSRVSQLATDFAEEIEEVDVNPLVCAGSRIIAVDALVKLRNPPHV